MQIHHAAKPETNRLRIVFGDEVVSFGISHQATFEDIACKLAWLTEQDVRTPVAIDVKFTSKTPQTPQMAQHVGIFSSRLSD